MTNIKKRIVCLMIMAMVVLSGCSSSQKQTVFHFSDDSYSAQYCSYTDANYEWTRKAEKLDSNIQQNVNKLCSDLCDYLNKEYDANWKCERIEVYSSNLTDELKEQTSSSLNYGALYYDGNVYVDASFLENGLNDQTTYIVSHELVHYLYEYNTNDEMFVLNSEKGVCCGRYLDEAMVDSLARKFMLAKNPDIKENNFESRYQLIRLCVDLLAVEETDIYQYFFRNDIEGFKKRIDKKAREYLICKGSPFEKMVSMMDEITITEDMYLVEDRISSLVTFLATITSSENSEKFIERAMEEGYDFEAFLSVMH